MVLYFANRGDFGVVTLLLDHEARADVKHTSCHFHAPRHVFFFPALINQSLCLYHLERLVWEVLADFKVAKRHSSPKLKTLVDPPPIAHLPMDMIPIISALLLIARAIGMTTGSAD